jgi:hypothetical protein
MRERERENIFQLVGDEMQIYIYILQIPCCSYKNMCGALVIKAWYLSFSFVCDSQLW